MLHRPSRAGYPSMRPWPPKGIHPHTPWECSTPPYSTAETAHPHPDSRPFDPFSLLRCAGCAIEAAEKLCSGRESNASGAKRGCVRTAGVANQVPQGRLIHLTASEWISRPCGTGSTPDAIPRTCVLGYFQPSLRDFIGATGVLTHALKAQCFCFCMYGLRPVPFNHRSFGKAV